MASSSDNSCSASAVAELCYRLRLIQADAAGLGRVERRELLREEISRSSEGLSGQQRKQWLHAALARMPIAGEVQLETQVKIEEGFTELMDRFITGALALPQQQREEMVRVMQERGLLDLETPRKPDNQGNGNGLTEETARCLNILPGHEPTLDQMGRLCCVLLDVLQKLDQTALATLRELSPKSPLLKKREDIRSGAGQYLVASPEIIEAHLRNISTLIGALMAGFLGGGRDFGRQYVERLSPAAIEDVVRSEGGVSIFGRNLKERCWDKYTLLAKDFETPDVVDRRIRDCLAAFIERKILGR